MSDIDAIRDRLLGGYYGDSGEGIREGIADLLAEVDRLRGFDDLHRKCSEYAAEINRLKDLGNALADSIKLAAQPATEWQMKCCKAWQMKCCKAWDAEVGR